MGRFIEPHYDADNGRVLDHLDLSALEPVRYEVVCSTCRLAYHGPLGACPHHVEAAK